MRKPKKTCHICYSPDLRYASGPLLKRQVTCGSCGNQWSDGRTDKARKRLAVETGKRGAK